MGNPQSADATAELPVQSQDRIITLDFIRGIAVLGIVFANITAFGQPTAAYFWPPALSGGANPADEAVWLFQFIFVDGKFRGLFTILFGAGLYLFLERAWARGASRWLQFRRLILLMLFGLLHYFLIWTGDILTLYAVWGIVALSTMTWQAKTQLKVGITILVGGTAFMAVLTAANYVAATSTAIRSQLPADAREELGEAVAKTLERSQEHIAAYSGDSYLAIVLHQLGQWSDLLAELVLIGLTETLGLILIGCALYRIGFFTGAVSPQWLRRWGWRGLGLGLALALGLGLWAYLSGFEFFTTLLVFNGLAPFAHLPTAFGLLALLAAYAPKLVSSALGARFVAAGRMAFSNYLGTSIAMMFVFHGWALGLYGKLHRPEMLLVVVLVWAAMLIWSKAWLARFRYGPLEWLWRSLTYGRLFPLRR